MTVPVIGERYTKVMELLESGDTLTDCCKAVNMSPQAFHAACARNPKLAQMYDEFKKVRAAHMYDQIGYVGEKVIERSLDPEKMNHQEIKAALDVTKFYTAIADEKYRLNANTQAVQVNVFNDLIGEAQGFGDILATDDIAQAIPHDEPQE